MDVPDEFQCVVSEIARGDKNSLRRFVTRQCAHKILNFNTANGVLPAFGLNVNYIQTESVVIDDTVYSGVVGHLGDFRRLSFASAVPHCDEEIHDELFEVEWVH